MRLRSGDFRKKARGARKKPQARQVKVSKLAGGTTVVKDRRHGKARAYGKPKAKDFERFVK